jgi:hypothetical protein
MTTERDCQLLKKLHGDIGAITAQMGAQFHQDFMLSYVDERTPAMPDGECYLLFSFARVNEFKGLIAKVTTCEVERVRHQGDKLVSYWSPGYRVLIRDKDDEKFLDSESFDLLEAVDVLGCLLGLLAVVVKAQLDS